MLTQATVREYAARLASGAPTPGGGSAAALVGALAAALGEMVGNFTVGKPKYAAVEADVQRILAALEAQRTRLLDLTDADADAYSQVGAAFGLPRATDEEKAARAAAIEEALKSAAQVPLAVMEACAAVCDQLEELRQKGNPNLLSDVGVAAELTRAALRCAWLNVEVNLALVKDEGYLAQVRAAMAERIGCVEATTQEVFARVAEAVRGEE
jgi:formiminotetrahydrofolate cyclodeaminase